MTTVDKGLPPKPPRDPRDPRQSGQRPKPKPEPKKTAAAPRWGSASLPGVCCRCDRVYLTGHMVQRDQLGGLRAVCCAITAGRAA